MVFVLEDDANIRKLLSYALQKAGFAVKGFSDAKALYGELEEQLPCLLILDLMLPGEDGFSVLERLRSSRQTQRLPVIILTAKNSEVDKLQGLDGGADDYVTKPFGVAELIARVRAVLRRAGDGDMSKSYQISSLAVDDERHAVSVRGKNVFLSKKEYDLLLLLLRAEGRVCKRESLIAGVWGESYGESRTLDVHIRRLRQKLESEGELIHTVKGVGYRLGTDVDEA